ncbi:MAG TPA: hypothetical protein VK676_01610, partial [Steroidobacteraceae bacterium]|nr:hypothetical protein [Steroidobacteraceae bacterium]
AAGAQHRGTARMTLWVRFRSADGRVCCGALEPAGVREYAGVWFKHPVATDRVIRRRDRDGRAA